MRIRVSDILEMLAENVSTSEILEDFPDLEMADIQACLVFAARRTDFSPSHLGNSCSSFIFSE
jgi:uncharacterized protein (DUF433 family)